MRVEVPNRTEDSDKHIQNATNNLINRSENRRNLMLAWHTTGAQGMRTNTVRTIVMRAVQAANPPLPPNSTRGLTPGLIDPQLGDVPGNSVPQPELRGGQGRLRVGLGRQRTAQTPVVPQKRGKTSKKSKGGPKKRRAVDPSDSSEEDPMDVDSEGDESSDVCEAVPNFADLADLS